ncbi:hypothetical protein JTB14_009617 [Gonioctena quinquepunctata]|nr:hypothetical protein JTB14_009617 [Gonioctena quinquepunctata]
MKVEQIKTEIEEVKIDTDEGIECKIDDEITLEENKVEINEGIKNYLKKESQFLDEEVQFKDNKEIDIKVEELFNSTETQGNTEADNGFDTEDADNYDYSNNSKECHADPEDTTFEQNRVLYEQGERIILGNCQLTLPCTCSNKNVSRSHQSSDYLVNYFIYKYAGLANQEQLRCRNIVQMHF